jgi:hypothetical protein
MCLFSKLVLVRFHDFVECFNILHLFLSFLLSLHLILVFVVFAMVVTIDYFDPFFEDFLLGFIQLISHLLLCHFLLLKVVIFIEIKNFFLFCWEIHFLIIFLELFIFLLIFHLDHFYRLLKLV